MAQRRLGNMSVAGMGRIEAAAEQPDAQAAFVAKPVQVRT